MIQTSYKILKENGLKDEDITLGAVSIVDKDEMSFQIKILLWDIWLQRL